MVKKKKSKHDEAVRRVAGGFKSQGWDVKADVGGYSAPRTMYGRQPDVVARKGKRVRVVEVETPKSYNTDGRQRASFKRWASLDRKRKFRVKITK